jgi:hypothetical protein
MSESDKDVADNKSIDISGRFDDETFIRLNEVRKSIWNGGMTGLVFGVAIGISGFTASKHFVPQLKAYFPNIQKVYTKNTFVLAVLLTGSVGSFVGASTNGRNAFQYVGDIFKSNLTNQSSYRSHLIDNENNVVESIRGEDNFNRRDAAIRRSAEIKQQEQEQQKWK